MNTLRIDAIDGLDMYDASLLYSIIYWFDRVKLIYGGVGPLEYKPYLRPQPPF